MLLQRRCPHRIQPQKHHRHCHHQYKLDFSCIFCFACSISHTVADFNNVNDVVQRVKNCGFYGFRGGVGDKRGTFYYNFFLEQSDKFFKFFLFRPFWSTSSLYIGLCCLLCVHWMGRICQLFIFRPIWSVSSLYIEWCCLPFLHWMTISLRNM